ncbi:MAG TPA: pyridoxamine 5'-phosphate oxidase, partial [Rhodobacteraceae bacterium]|nr:pyridoxamine 5'-phosphate oxidase [Paracoccaceae bacterium]
SVYFGTASRDGQPYIQHRGGPPGFLQILDARTLMFFDYPGNKQYISLGNLAENPKAFLFMMDYPTKTRIKFWGRAGVDFGQDGTRRILFHIEAWDINCRKHIPNLVPADTTSPE